MALFSGNIEDLRTLYTKQLQMLLSAEQQIIKALPKMAEAATDPQLKQALQTHLQETEVHEDRLEQILGELTGEWEEKKCAVTAALISAGETIIKDTVDDSTRDAGIIAAAQKVEHFEMASYGAVRNWAQVLGYPQHAQLLNQTLQEEGNADKLLTGISDRANAEATRAA